MMEDNFIREWDRWIQDDIISVNKCIIDDNVHTTPQHIIKSAKFTSTVSVAQYAVNSA